jgi:hypothetical protein
MTGESTEVKMSDQMNELNDPRYRTFVQNIIDNIKKNGFPEKRVAFGLEKLYDAAEKKDLNLNRVLQILDDIQIAHEKTPEKIIFFPKPAQVVSEAVPEAAQPSAQGVDPAMFEGMDMSMFAGVDPSMFAGLDLNNIKNMSLPQMMGMVGKLMKNMTPDQMKSIKDMYDNMSDEQKSSILEKAKDFNPFNKKTSPDE